MEHLNRAQRLHEAIREAFLRQWDPIGVGHVPEARDEYDAYVAHVYKMLIARRPAHEVFDYLWQIETVHMGLAGDRQATARFAETLIMLA